MSHDFTERLWRESWYVDSFTAAELLGKVVHKMRDVLSPFPKRRKLNLNALQPVVEIFPELVSATKASRSR